MILTHFDSVICSVDDMSGIFTCFILFSQSWLELKGSLLNPYMCDVLFQCVYVMSYKYF